MVVSKSFFLNPLGEMFKFVFLFQAELNHQTIPNFSFPHFAHPPPPKKKKKTQQQPGLVFYPPGNCQVLRMVGGHYSYTKGLLLLDSSGLHHRSLELTSESCRPTFRRMVFFLRKIDLTKGYEKNSGLITHLRSWK